MSHFTRQYPSAVRLEKMNPNHDETGRFSSGSATGNAVKHFNEAKLHDIAAKTTVGEVSAAHLAASAAHSKAGSEYDYASKMYRSDGLIADSAVRDAEVMGAKANDLSKTAKIVDGSSLSALYASVAKPDGGFTYQPTSGHQPTKGYALSIYPDRSVAMDATKISSQDLVDYAAKNSDLFVKSDHYMGAWHDPETGKVFLDVSVVKTDEKEAIALALKHDQIAYFDLGNFKSVTVKKEYGNGQGQAEAGPASGGRLSGRDPGTHRDHVQAPDGQGHDSGRDEVRKGQAGPKSRRVGLSRFVSTTHQGG
jgi:hypothetical protein